MVSSVPSKVVEISVHPDDALDFERVRERARRAARLRVSEVGAVKVLRRSVDARKGNVRIRLRVEVLPPGASAPVDACRPRDFPALHGEPRVTIVGAGPAGLFCAWALAGHGIKSVVFDRGKPVRPRRRSLADLTRHGALDPQSNYCYGEGGAGTFSDGKLYTRSQKRGRLTDVLEALVGYGATPQILVDARPHIGTNRLPGVITAMREHLVSAGVEFRFDSSVIGLSARDGRAHGVILADGTSVPSAAVVIATGHSARDVQRVVAQAGAAVEPKPFAMGVRIEHPQDFIDRVQYGDLAGHPALGAAPYRLVEHVAEQSVFSFCMCPGGFICPAATEPDGQVVNGWSPSSRSGRYANSGWVTQIGPPQLRAAGFDPADPWAGTLYQRSLEQAAYRLGGGAFTGPAQRLDDFVDSTCRPAPARGRVQDDLPPCSYPRGVVAAPLSEILGPLTDPLRVALQQVDRKMPGFIGEHALAVAVESRTSSPIRICRDPQTLQSPTLAALYPCGEGAGFAGGIVSAALDGITIAHHLARHLR